MILLKLLLVYVVVLLAAWAFGFIGTETVIWDVFSVFLLLLLAYSIGLAFDSCHQWTRRNDRNDRNSRD